MPSLHDLQDTQAIVTRVESLAEDAQPLWGSMNLGQAFCHCSRGLEAGLGRSRPPRLLLGRLISWIFRARFLGPQPFSKNSPTGKDLVVADAREVARERERLIDLLRAFQAAGPENTQGLVHPFFGSLSPEEWGWAMWKHMDHHLRQFGA